MSLWTLLCKSQAEITRSHRHCLGNTEQEIKGFAIYTKVSLFLPGDVGHYHLQQETSWVQLLLLDTLQVLQGHGGMLPSPTDSQLAEDKSSELFFLSLPGGCW